MYFNPFWNPHERFLHLMTTIPTKNIIHIYWLTWVYAKYTDIYLFIYLLFKNKNKMIPFLRLNNIWTKEKHYSRTKSLSILTSTITVLISRN